jgi:glycine/D-amino acid oxidase-like deaminating enzyme/nitrite reductase/ring-hydroxylating ferredoxin subunit
MERMAQATRSFAMQERLVTPNVPGVPESCWSAKAPKFSFPKLSGPVTRDVVVVGGGIVGLSTALRLIEQGRSVVVLEAREIGAQVTGRSTAKITSQHGLIYRELIDRFGLKRAQLYADANKAGCDQVERWIGTYGIDCDYETKSAYAYSCIASKVADIKDEVEAASKMGFAASFLDEAPLPFATAGAICFRHQAQFNPTSYLICLAKAAEAAGGQIFTHSRAMKLDKSGNKWRVDTESGSVKANAVVVATNLPVESPVGYSNRTQPRCHVAMAYRLPYDQDIDGMFIGVDDPTHSIRTGADNDGELLIVLGPRFDTGTDGDVAERFRDLDIWVRENISQAGAPIWRWCNEDYETADRVPYVGQPAPDKAPNYFIATGFNGWGISNGTAAGISIADTIVSGESAWRTLYDPCRPFPKDFHRNGHSQSLIKTVDDILPGGAGVIERNGEQLAVWRDGDGALHAVSAICTHKGCTVTWNNADRTWDCPCHGSIFETGGAVIHGPAREALPRRNL